MDPKRFGYLVDRQARAPGLDQVTDLSICQPDLTLIDRAGTNHLAPSGINYLSSLDVALVRVLSS